MTPFGTPWLAFADTLRAFCVAGGIALAVGAGFRLISHGSTSPTVRCGYLALAVLGVSAIGTEYQHLGDHVTYRLWCNTAGVALGLAAVVLAVRERNR
ncbi:hypothetical protein [Amycolatopsis sp. CA-128772]|uniref:hypothetical protein n=1 Tax=Amycolatopsis sp. CA-128772 TaxID=2073159 RepID=UPI000CD114D4|nr:hypothetical protein [Amycolatopsis sp. CA-128772]